MTDLLMSLVTTFFASTCTGKLVKVRYRHGLSDLTFNLGTLTTEQREAAYAAVAFIVSGRDLPPHIEELAHRRMATALLAVFFVAFLLGTFYVDGLNR